MVFRKMSILTHERVSDLLDYDPATGALTWKIATCNKVKPGDAAGVVAANGRRYVSIENEKHLAHRVAWFMVNKVWPTGNVAPINGDYLDLRWDNLKEETPSETARKGGARARGSSGIKGVSYDKTKDKWLAYITRDYKMKYLGRFDTKEEAAAAYEKAAAGHHLSGEELQREELDRNKLTAKQRYHYRKMLKDNAGVCGWADFSAFAADIGRPPKDGHAIRPLDVSRAIGPENFHWVEIKGKFEHQTREGRREYDIHRRETLPASYRNYELRRNFGMTLEQYQEKLVEQNGVCAVCAKPETAVRRGKVQSLAVDHCHDSGVVRDLLCEQCNKGIGFFKDNPETLEAAALYLRKHVKRIAESGTNVIPIATGRRTNT